MAKKSLYETEGSRNEFERLVADSAPSRTPTPRRYSIALLLALTVGAVYFAFFYKEPTSKIPVIECYHHVIQSGENLEDAVSFFRRGNPGVEISDVVKQNHLPLDFSVYEGRDVVYCHSKLVDPDTL